MTNATAFSTHITVTAGELPQLIRDASLAKRPLMIHGSPGLGKSAQAYQAAEDLRDVFGLERVVELGDTTNALTDFGYFDIRLTSFGPEEYGLPSLDVERGVQVRNPVDWFPSTDRTDLPDRGILIFEEAVSVGPAMQATMYQITHERRLGNKRMKPGWQVVLTGNLLTDGGQVFKMLTPLANRLIHVYVVSSVDGWTKHAIDHNFEPVLIAFIRFRPELLNTFATHVEKKAKDHAFATERSWECVQDLIRVNPNIHPAMLSGSVGNGPATEFNAFREIWQSMPNIDGILMDPANAPVPTDTAVRYAVCTALASRATGQNFDLICQYIERMPTTYTIMTIKDCAQRKKGEITSTRAFIKCASQYGEYLS